MEGLPAANLEPKSRAILSEAGTERSETLARSFQCASLNATATRRQRVPESMSTATLERNKRNVVAFCDFMFDQCRPAEAIELYAGAGYMRHNLHVADGRHAFIDFLERMAREYSGKRVHFKRVLAEDDSVALDRHQEWPTDAKKDWAGIDIVRLDADARIVEHRDVLQVLPAQSANGNSMFQHPRPGDVVAARVPGVASARGDRP